MYESVKLKQHEGVALVTLNRPDRYNAWHSEMRGEVIHALDALRRDESVRAVVITGEGGKAFCAGQDLAESRTFDGDSADTWMDEWCELYGAVRALEVPVVAALNGVAAGSGFQFALLCDIRVAHHEVSMGQTEINAGLPSVTGAWIMWDLLGRSRTTELVLTGRMMNAEEGYRLGLIHHLVTPEQVLPRALEIARDLAAKPPLAMRLNKRRLREITEPGFVEAEQAGRVIHRQAYASGEPQAMMEKFFAERARPGR